MDPVSAGLAALSFWKLVQNFTKIVGKLGLDVAGFVSAVNKGAEVMPEISGNKSVFEPTKVFTARDKASKTPRNE